MRVGCEVGAIGFNEKFIVWNLGQDVDQFFGILKGDDSADTKIKSLFCKRKKLVIGVIAVQNSPYFTSTLFEEYHFCIMARVANMDNQRLFNLFGKSYMSAENFILAGFFGIFLFIAPLKSKIIQSAFTDRNAFRMSGICFEINRFDMLHIIRMYPNGKIDILIRFAQLYRPWQCCRMGSGDDKPFHSRFVSACHHFLKILAVAFIIQIDMGIDNHTVPRVRSNKSLANPRASSLTLSPLIIRAISSIRSSGFSSRTRLSSSL